MSEQTYQWPTAEQVHEWFGKHPTDAKTDEIKKLLSEAFDDVAALPEGIYRAMFGHYDEALTHGLCPCGSKATFGGCCKNDWLFVKRGRAKVVEEAKDAQRQQHEVDKAAEEEDAVDWLVQVGVTKKNRVMLGATSGHEGKEMNPEAISRLLHEAVDGLDKQMLMEDVLNAVGSMMAQAQQRAQAAPPKGITFGPDGKPLHKH